MKVHIVSLVVVGFEENGQRVYNVSAAYSRPHKKFINKTCLVDIYANVTVCYYTAS